MTVREIAKTLQVAPSTVSLVLNGKPGVKKEKREKIAALLRESGYTIKDTATPAPGNQEIKFIRYLAANHSRERSEDFFAGILSGAEMKAHALGYNFSFHSVAPEQFSSLLTSMERQPNLTGAILLACELTKDKLAALQSFSKPIVTLDMPAELDMCPVNGINTDNRGGIYMAVKTLYDLGHRSIGFLKGATDIGGFTARFRAYLDAMNLLGLPVTEEHILTIDARYEVAIRQMEGFIRTRSSLPTAFVAANDIIAAGCVRALCLRGYSVPGDISVIGFDNGNMSTFITPPLTTMGINRTRMGELAVERIVSLAQNPDDVIVKSILSVSLIERESVRGL